MTKVTFRDICYKNNIRYTRVRAELFDLLVQESPLLSHDFMQLAISKGFDQVSIYRTIYLFERLGICDSYGSGKNRVLHAHTESANHHHFIRCTNCGRAFEFENEAIEMQLQAIATRAGFSQVSSHFLEISGICAKCNQSARIA